MEPSLPYYYHRQIINDHNSNFKFSKFKIFLNNISQGFKREWAPFVLTPDFVYVMGGEVGIYVHV